MELLFTIIVCSVFAWIGAEMAKTRNRNVSTWAAICFLFGILGIIVLALVGKVEPPQNPSV